MILLLAQTFCFDCVSEISCCARFLGSGVPSLLFVEGPAAHNTVHWSHYLGLTQYLHITIMAVGLTLLL